MDKLLGSPLLLLRVTHLYSYVLEIGLKSKVSGVVFILTKLAENKILFLLIL